MGREREREGEGGGGGGGAPVSLTTVQYFNLFSLMGQAYKGTLGKLYFTCRNSFFFRMRAGKFFTPGSTL